MNFFTFCDAPPIKNPSRLTIFFNSLIFFGLTDPPYRIFGGFDLNCFFIKAIVCSRSLILGILPVPIDQTGSYAINILDFF